MRRESSSAAHSPWARNCAVIAPMTIGAVIVVWAMMEPTVPRWTIGVGSTLLVSALIFSARKLGQPCLALFKASPDGSVEIRGQQGSLADYDRRGQRRTIRDQAKLSKVDGMDSSIP